MSRPPIDLLARLPVTPTPSYITRELHWLYTGRLLAPKGAPYRYVKTADGGVRRKAQTYIPIPQNVSFQGQPMSPLRALMAYFSGPDIPEEQRCRAIPVTPNKKTLLNSTVPMPEAHFRLMPCAKRMVHPSGNFVIRCCNPYHAQILSINEKKYNPNRGRPRKLPQEPDPEPDLLLADTDPLLEELVQLIREWTETNNLEEITTFQRLYVQTGDWTPAQLSDALASLVRRDILTPRWKALLTQPGALTP